MKWHFAETCCKFWTEDKRTRRADWIAKIVTIWKRTGKWEIKADNSAFILKLVSIRIAKTWEFVNGEELRNDWFLKRFWIK